MGCNNKINDKQAIASRFVAAADNNVGWLIGLFGLNDGIKIIIQTLWED